MIHRVVTSLGVVHLLHIPCFSRLPPIHGLDPVTHCKLLACLTSPHGTVELQGARFEECSDEHPVACSRVWKRIRPISGRVEASRLAYFALALRFVAVSRSITKTLITTMLFLPFSVRSRLFLAVAVISRKVSITLPLSEPFGLLGVAVARASVNTIVAMSALVIWTCS